MAASETNIGETAKPAIIAADDPRQILGNRRMTMQQYGVVLLCILVNMIDGYDILAISLAGSSLKGAWGLSDAALGTLLAMHLIGMAAGALCVSPVADQWGRRPAILACLLFMCAGMIISANADGMTVMVVGRLVAGIGIGGMTSTVGMIALEYASFRRREFAASAVASAYPVGLIIGAWVASTALQGYDWRAIFWFGAALSGLLFPLALIFLPESLDFLLNRQPKNALSTTNRVLKRMSIGKIATLPAKPKDTKSAVLLEIKQPFHIRELLKLFLAHALNMFAWYFIMSWGTPLIAEVYSDGVQGAHYSSWLSYGGIAGGLSAGLLCGRLGVKKMMWFFMVSLGVLIALFGYFIDNVQAMWIIAPLIGAALFGSAVANWLTIAYAFPPQLRATGLGFATTAGRIGAVGGPWVGGRLLDSRSSGEVDLALFSFDGSLTITSICILMAIPALLSAITFSQARRLEPGR